MTFARALPATLAAQRRHAAASELAVASRGDAHLDSPRLSGLATLQGVMAKGARALQQQHVLQAMEVENGGQRHAIDQLVQAKLNPLGPNVPKPGRLPDNETTLKEVLLANGFDEIGYLKACSDPAHEVDLTQRMSQVLVVDGKFNTSNLKPAKRRKLRDELAFEYDSLLDQADRNRQDANQAYRTEQDLTCQGIRNQYPAVNELFKGGAPWKAVGPGTKPSARVDKWMTQVAFAEEVRKRYKALYKTKTVLVSPLSQQDQLSLATEKQSITSQLNTWSNLPNDAEGCNDNGTWGTSATGAGGNFAVTTVNTKVWAELKAWWRGKSDTYVSLSDTSNYSLKKHRNHATLSPTFNYHINVA